MLDQKELNQLISFLDECKSETFVTECLDYIKNKEVYLDSGMRIDTSHALDTYSNRYKLQKEREQEIVIGYENLISSLKVEKHPEVLIYTLTTKNATYLIFTSVGLDRLLGTLKSSKGSTAKLSRLHEIYKDKGLGISSSRVKNGEA